MIFGYCIWLSQTNLLPTEKLQALCRTQPLALFSKRSPPHIIIVDVALIITLTKIIAVILITMTIIITTICITMIIISILITTRYQPPLNSTHSREPLLCWTKPTSGPANLSRIRLGNIFGFMYSIFVDLSPSPPVY